MSAESIIKALWQPNPEAVAASNLQRFIEFVGGRTGQAFSGYEPLRAWSVQEVEAFWECFWDFAEIRSSVRFTTVLENPKQMPGARWFPGARLNFAQNLLRFRDEQTALVFYGEDQLTRRLTYAELYEQVQRAANGFRKLGLGPGDRVAAFMPNMPETVVAMLAATSLGAVWSSCSPDFGIQGVLDRFGQIKPRVLLATESYFFKGRVVEVGERLQTIVGQIPSIERTVVVPLTGSSQTAQIRGRLNWDDFTSESAPLVFEQLPFDHPVYIMYSSGTTGLPKCMVQGVGVLLNHLKEHILHTDISRDDTVFYFTTCGWMMWNWLVSGLATGATLVLFDGNPLHPGPEFLWQMAEREGISVFGTSARYLRAVEEAGTKPGEVANLQRLRALLSTGSPLAPEQFDWAYANIKSDMQLASISGGTDLNGCFALGNPIGPVFRGEIQCRGLGMDVEIFDEQGRAVVAEKGELVCRKPFPSMPLYFWDDPDGSRYHAAYFDRFENVWCHGDFAELTPSGGLIVYGRSDATLNPGGVRIGTADLYSVLESMEEVEDSVVVGQDWKDDVRVVLFVKLPQGLQLDEALERKIRKRIREEVSPRHVPAKILTVADIPYTLNMKKVELAVRKVIHGQEVRNRDALRNPESLAGFADRWELTED